LGYNYRSSEIASILGLDQLSHLDLFLEKRRTIARYYDVAIGNIKGIKPQQITPETDSCYNYYTVQVEQNSGLDRDHLVQELRGMGIETAVHYPKTLTEQPALREYVKHSCPVAEELSRRVFSIPIHPFMSERDMERVVLGLRSLTG
jgi:perosamine synthetase